MLQDAWRIKLMICRKLIDFSDSLLRRKDKESLKDHLDETRCYGNYCNLKGEDCGICNIEDALEELEMSSQIETIHI